MHCTYGTRSLPFPWVGSEIEKNFTCDKWTRESFKCNNTWELIQKLLRQRVREIVNATSVNCKGGHIDNVLNKGKSEEA